MGWTLIFPNPCNISFTRLAKQVHLARVNCYLCKTVA